MYKIVNLELGETAVGGFATEEQAEKHIDVCKFDKEIYCVVEEVKPDGWEMQWTTNEIIKDIEAIGTRIGKHEFTESQKADIRDQLELLMGDL